MQTFVVRLWKPGSEPSDLPRGPLRGVVEELASGRSTAFAHDRELLAFLKGAEEERQPVGGGAS